jgi:hypothetical protein
MENLAKKFPEITSENLLTQLQGKIQGTDIWSVEFLFNRKYAESRNEILPEGYCPFFFRSYLSLLLREGMTSERRDQIFSDEYDLGNRKTLPSEKCCLEALATSLSEKYLVGSASEFFETVNYRIVQFTGKTIAEHLKINESSTIKVVKTLKLALLKNDRILQWIEPPERTNKFSFEMRTSCPYEKNKEQVWEIADLETILSSELIEERFTQIRMTFFLIERLLDATVHRVDEIFCAAKSSNQLSEMMHAYGVMLTLVDEFIVTHNPKDLPLDEELFIYLQRLPFSHYAIGFEQLMNDWMPKRTVTPVFKEVRDFARSVFFQSSKLVNAYDPLLSFNELSKFTRIHGDEIRGIVEKAMGIELNKKRFKRLQTPVQNLLHIFYYFRVTGYSPFDLEAKQISPRFLFAAYCCVLYVLESGIKVKAYWPGQSAQGGSIFTSIKSRHDAMRHEIDNVPEEHRIVWSNMFEWFDSALNNQIELKELRKRRFNHFPTV